MSVEIRRGEIPIVLTSPEDTVSLRQLIPGDAPELYRLLQTNRDSLKRFLPIYEDGLSSCESVKRYLETDQSFPNRYRFGISDGAVLVGQQTLYPVGNNNGEVTTWVAAEFSGNDYAARAGKLLVEFAFDRLGFTKLISHVDIRNKVALKLVLDSGLRRSTGLSIFEFPVQHFTLPNPNPTP